MDAQSPSPRDYKFGTLSSREAVRNPLAEDIENVLRVAKKKPSLRILDDYRPKSKGGQGYYLPEGHATMKSDKIVGLRHKNSAKSRKSQRKTFYAESNSLNSKSNSKYSDSTPSFPSVGGNYLSS